MYGHRQEEESGTKKKSVWVATDHHAVVGLRLLVGEVADGPGHVVRGHSRRAGEAIGHPAVLLGQRAAFHGHVGQRRVLRVVVEGEGERGLVDGLVEAGEGLPGVGRTELGHRQVAGRQKKKEKQHRRLIPGKFCPSRE